MAGRPSTRLTASEGRKFGFTVGGAFLVLAGLMIWRGHEVLIWTFGSLGVLLGIGGLLVPTRLGPVHDGWMRLAHAISKVTTPIVMTVVYYLVITPTALIRRTFGRNPLRHPARDGGYWLARSESRSDLERQF